MHTAEVAAAATEEYAPAAHAVHPVEVELATVLLYVPAAHDVQPEVPVDNAENAPIAQAVQLAPPSPSVVYDPRGQACADAEGVAVAVREADPPDDADPDCVPVAVWEPEPADFELVAD